MKHERKIICLCLLCWTRFDDALWKFKCKHLSY